MDKEAIFSQQDEGDSTVYQGPLGATAFEPVHWAAPSGKMISVRVYRVVNAATDPVLAQRLAAGTLNWVRLEEDDQLYPVRVPVIYHDPGKRLFALLLPEDFRCRELEERAALLSRLAEDKAHALPRYVLDFHVLYGYESLQALLEGRIAARPVETTPVRAVSHEYLRRTTSSEAVTTRAFVPGDDQNTGKVLQVSEADLLAVEDLPSGQAEDESDSGARAVLQAEAEAVLEEMEGMEGWPFSAAQPGGAGKDLLDEPSEGSEGGGADREATKVAALDAQALSEEASESVEQERGAEDASPLPAEASGSEGALDGDESASGGSGPTVQAERAAEAEPTPEPEPAEEADQEPELPEALAGWPESGESERFYVEKGEQTVVVLAAKGDSDTIMGFLGSDAEVLIQLHELPSYPLVVLAALPKDKPDLARFWLVDVLDDSHLDLLDALTADFRVQVDIYDENYRRQASVRAHYPLEENTKIIRKTAMEHLTAMGDLEPDFQTAKQEWAGEDFPKLGDREHAFTVRSFEKLETPSQAATALGIVEWWADAEHEPYLLMVKSFPAVWWRKIKNRVVKAALEYGLWPPDSLVAFALSEGLATSKKDLIRHCLDRFCRTSEDSRLNDLDLSQEDENWTKLLAEAEAAGIVPSEEVEGLVAQVRARMEVSAGAKAAGSEDEDGEDAEALPLDDADIVEESDHLPEEAVEEEDREEAQEPPAVSGELPMTAEEIFDADAVAEVVDETGGAPDSEAAGASGQEPAEASGQEPAEAFSDGDAGAALEAQPRAVSETGVPARSLRDLSNEELTGLLSDKEKRLAAALVLSERRDPATLGPLFDAVGKMTRSEVLEVLPGLVAFGAAAEAPLIELLSSNKSFLRQGAALALGILRSGPAMEALVDCLLTEPTGIWREVARVVGEMGKPTVMILASRLRTASGEGRDRIAWALAHVGAVSEDLSLLGDLSRSADETMAEVAKRAAELVQEAKEASRIYEEEPRDDESVVVSFTRAFLNALTGEAAELGDDDILESKDLHEE